MTSWLLMRAIIHLKRCSLSLASIAESQRIIASASLRATPEKRPKPRVAEVFTPSIDSLNETWESEHGDE